MHQPGGLDKQSYRQNQLVNAIRITRACLLMSFSSSKFLVEPYCSGAQGSRAAALSSTLDPWV